MKIAAHVVALAALLYSTIATAAAPDGLVLDFRLADAVELVGTSTAAVDDRANFRDGPHWTLAIESADGRSDWSKAIVPPAAFHANPEEIRFSLVVPRPASGSRLVLRNERNAIVWSRQVDAALIADATQEGKRVRAQLGPAFAATAQLMDPERKSLLPLQPGRRATPPPAAQSIAIPRLPPSGTKAARAEGMYRVTGHVEVNRPIVVRAYAAGSGQFIASTEQYWATGRFELVLPAGSYVFEVDDNQLFSLSIDSPLFYGAPTRTAPIRISADTELTDLIPDRSYGQLRLSVTQPCPMGYSPALTIAVTATSGNGVRVERAAYRESDSGPDERGNCTAPYSIRLSPGTYAIEASPPGWDARRYDNVRIDIGTLIERDETFTEDQRTHVWRGRVVDENGQPYYNLHLQWSDGLHNDTSSFAAWRTDSDGRFETVYRRNWSATFHLWDADGAVTRHVVNVGNDPLPSTIVLPRSPFLSVNEGGLMRLYGDGNRTNRFNILFLGDGYVGARESYTDLNGNGQWDGYVLLDLNQNGIYDASDPVMFYGTPEVYPLPTGAKPTDYSEPFVDANNDGVPNIDDAAIFHHGTREFMRALLGSDVFNEHRDAFNAYVLFEPSEQAGYSVVTDTGSPLITRRNLYGSTLQQGRSLLYADRRAVMHRALAVLPEVDIVVLLINEAAPAAARGNVTISEPGSMLWPSGYYASSFDNNGPAHEMAHFIGSLCDEYVEFPGNHPQAGNVINWCPNVSLSASPVDIPWINGLAPSTPIPNRDLVATEGVFEGGDYYFGGAFRPSFSSLMQSTSTPRLNTPSRAAIERAIRARTQINTLPDRHGRLPHLLPVRPRPQP